MRWLVLSAVLCGCGLLAGCSRSGDFGEFIVREVAKHGGHTRTNVALPKLEAHWRVKSKENSFRATVTGVAYTNLDAFMHLAYGEPKLSIEGFDLPGGQPLRVWGVVETGVAIELLGRADDEAEIQCERRIRDLKEITESITNKP